MHTVGPGVWKDNGPIQKMSKSPGRTWNITRNTEKREKREMYTVGPGKWREN